MDTRPSINTSAAIGGPAARGARVHVSDASPYGFYGFVTAVYPDAFTVSRDSGAHDLVIPSRRRVSVVAG
jgi:hypothetical protein